MIKVDIDKLRRLRKAIPLTQPELADKMGLARSTYAYKEKIGEFTEEEATDLVRFFQIKREELVIADTNGRVNEPAPVYQNGVDAKDEVIALLKEQILMLKDQVKFLQQSVPINLNDLREYGIANNSYLKTILECLGKHRAVAEKLKLEDVEAQHDTILAAKTREILKSGKP